MIEGYDAYKIYIGLKSHFSNKSYDYIKYHGKTSATKKSFLSRKDRGFFGKVARRYKEETETFFIANFLASPRGWIGDFNDDNYKEYIERNKDVFETFKNDIKYLTTIVGSKKSDFENIFRCEDGQHPLLLKQYMAKNVSLETLCVLERGLGFCNNFDNDIEEDMIWPIKRDLILKAQSLIVDDSECRLKTFEVVKEYFDE